jgi:pilus assembly protein CpaF
VVTVEDVAELEIGRDNWIALEARPGDSNGVPGVDVAMLIRSALRMRPDRLVVGEVRGTEALELVQAMASASDGAIASIAGEGAAAALSRLAAMARLGAPGMPHEAVRELVACAVTVVVHVARYADGVYRVASIHEVLGAAGDGFRTSELFCFRGGGFHAAGAVPRFYAELEERGVPADTSIFR